MHSKSVCAEVEYLTFSSLSVTWLLMSVFQILCNPVTFSVELENNKSLCEDGQPLKGRGVKTSRPNAISLQETPSRITASARIPRNKLVSCSQLAKTEER